jgi:hypothetical protein
LARRRQDHIPGAAAETVKRLEQAIQIGLDPETVKRLEQASQVGLDPDLRSRVSASLAIPLSQFRSVSAEVAIAVGLGPGVDQPLTRFADALFDADEADTDLVSEWLLGLSTTRQRKLLLLALGAPECRARSSGRRDRHPPSRALALVIYALIAFAVLLNEVMEPPTS